MNQKDDLTLNSEEEVDELQPNDAPRNQQTYLDEINNTIAYARAMTAVAIGSDFEDYEVNISNNFLGALDCVLEKLEILHKDLTNVVYQTQMIQQIETCQG